MLHHRTTNPAVRAEHVADMETRDDWRAPWPENWLKTYHEVLPLFAEEPTASEFEARGRGRNPDELANTR